MKHGLRESAHGSRKMSCFVRLQGLLLQMLRTMMMMIMRKRRRRKRRRMTVVRTTLLVEQALSALQHQRCLVTIKWLRHGFLIYVN